MGSAESISGLPIGQPARLVVRCVRPGGGFARQAALRRQTVRARHADFSAQGFLLS